MMHLHSMTPSSFPVWAGGRVLFEIADGGERVPRAISRMALEGIGGRRLVKAADLLGCFAEARARIEGLALETLHARPDGVSGRSSLRADRGDASLRSA